MSGYDDSKQSGDFDSHEEAAAYFREHAFAIACRANAKMIMLEACLHIPDLLTDPQAEAKKTSMVVCGLLDKLIIGLAPYGAEPPGA